MTVDADFEERLTAWLRSQLPGSDDVHVEGLDRVSFGHSAEMLMLTVVTRDGPRQTRQDVVLRLRPKPPALLEPYDLARQFRILRALQDTEVRVPRPLWLEETGEVFGRPFFVMERAAGESTRCRRPPTSPTTPCWRCARAWSSNSPRSIPSILTGPGSTPSMTATHTSTENSTTGPRK